MPQFDVVSVPKVTPKGRESSVLPGVEYDIYLQNRTGNTLRAVSLFAELHLLGGPLPSSIPAFEAQIEADEQRQVRFFFPLPVHVLRSVEERRTDDVSITLSIRGLCQVETREGKSYWDKVHASYVGEYSQKKWTDLLRILGYSDRWIIEIERPDIEGFDKIVEHVQDAAEAIARRDYETAVHNCRVAWDALEPLLSAISKDLDAGIDRSSPGEEGFSAKSQRILDLRKAIRTWSQIGAHKEAYIVRSEDAVLCHRITVSLLSYLSTTAASISTA